VDENLVRDIYQRMGRMEAKIDDIRAIRETANEADKKASEALRMSNENSKSIAGLGSTLKWAFGLLASILVPVSLAVLKIILGV